jgi:hypothetical protein
MKIILGFCAFLGVLAVAGWLAAHITGGMMLALVAVIWLGVVIRMIRGYRDSIRQEGTQHGKGRTSRRSADR